MGTRLKRLCEKWGEYGLGIRAEEYALDGVRLIRTSDITDDGELLPKEHGVFVDPGVVNGLELRTGDLLISRSGTVGRSLLFEEATHGQATFAAYLVRFRFKDGVDPRFIYYFTKSAPFQQQIELDSTQATILNFNAQKLGNLEVPSFSHEKQRDIVDFLDRETARIDDVVTRKKALLAVLRERSDTVVAGEGRLGRLEFSRDGLPEPPTEYPIVQLGRVADVQSGITLDSGRLRTDTDVTVPYLRVANVQTGFLDLTDIKQVTLPTHMADRARLRTGDVLMTEGGDRDKLGRGTVWRGEIPGCIHQNHIFAVRPDSERLLPDYLSYLTGTPYGRAYFDVTAGKTTGLASTSSRKIAAWAIPLPPLEVQLDIVQEAQTQEQGIARTLEKLSRQLNLLAEHRQALITAAVIGELKVPTHWRRSAGRV